MKNIQVVDAADNAVYDIFQATEEEFKLIFPDDTDIEFIEDLCERVEAALLDPIMNSLWKRRIPKKDAIGVHGILFYELLNKKKYYPTKKDEEAVNPDGSLLR